MIQFYRHLVSSRQETSLTPTIPNLAVYLSIASHLLFEEACDQLSHLYLKAEKNHAALGRLRLRDFVVLSLSIMTE
jgi:hypothetical protein